MRDFRSLCANPQCSFEAKLYQPAHAWAGTLSKDPAQMIKDPERFLEHLHTTGVAFVPKTQSNCRQLGLRTRADADDDGVTIFWRADAFELTDLDFLAMEDKKRNQASPHALAARRAACRPQPIHLADHAPFSSLPHLAAPLLATPPPHPVPLNPRGYRPQSLTSK